MLNVEVVIRHFAHLGGSNNDPARRKVEWVTQKAGDTASMPFVGDVEDMAAGLAVHRIGVVQL